MPPDSYPLTADDWSPRLGLPYLAAGQAQKHVTVNEAISALDGLIQTAVESASLAAEPATPPDGALYILPADRTGAEWSLHPPGSLLRFADGGWTRLAAGDGALAYVKDEAVLRVRAGEVWRPLGEALGELQNLARLGLGTEADAANPLAAKLNKALFTAQETEEGGDGDLRITFNKQSATDVLSLLLQSGYAGRAELGLVGDDDLSLKVSADGAAWTEALRAERATGRLWSGGLALERGLLANILPDSGRFIPQGSNGALTVATYGAPTWLQAAGGSVLAAHARFLHNNTDYGGTAGALDPRVRELIDRIRPAGARRYGPEWWVMRVTRGATALEPITVEGQIHDLPVTTALAPLPRLLTVGYYLRVVAGQAAVSPPTPEALSFDGVVQDGAAPRLLGPGDGWRFVNLLTRPNSFGYEFNLLGLRATAGAELLLAMPRVVFGHVRLDPTAGMLPNARVFG